MVRKLVIIVFGINYEANVKKGDTFVTTKLAKKLANAFSMLYYILVR